MSTLPASVIGSESSPYEQREPQWVTEMRDHFYKTGAYRASDLQRFLGNPCEPVETKTDPAFHYAAWLPTTD